MVEWHTGSKAKIDTSGTMHWYNVCTALWIEELKRWKRRVKLHHVEVTY